MTSIVNTTGQTGWAGRIADNTGGLNGVTILPMALSVSGSNLLQTGTTTRQIAIGTGTLSSVLSLAWGGPSAANPFNSGSGFRQLLTFDRGHTLIRGSSDTTSAALNADQILNHRQRSGVVEPLAQAYPHLQGRLRGHLIARLP